MGHGEALCLQLRQLRLSPGRRCLAETEPIERTILVDDLDGTVHSSLGAVWDSVFVIDPDGRVVLRRAWNDPTGVREALDQLCRGKHVAVESVDMAPPQSSDGVGHGLLRGGEKALLDFYRYAPPPVRQRLQASASEAVRSVVANADHVRA